MMRKSLSKKEEKKHIEFVKTRRFFTRCLVCKIAKIRTVSITATVVECECGSWIDLEGR